VVPRTEVFFFQDDDESVPVRNWLADLRKRQQRAEEENDGEEDQERDGDP
jgi:hypothetical protein